MIDLGKTQRDYAIFLPAISSFYVKQLEKLQKEGAPRIPEGLELGHEGMDFLKDKDPATGRAKKGAGIDDAYRNQFQNAVLDVF